MFKNHIKIALRNLVKNKGFTFINIIGLSVAFGVAILLSMTAFFELSYDQFHENKGSIYQIYTTEQTTKEPQVSLSNPVPLAPSLQEEIPGIDKISRQLEEKIILSFNDKQFNLDISWVDQDFFSIFSFPIVEGNKNHPLKELSSVVITQETAKNIFGAQDAIGKTVLLQINQKEEPFVISAIAEDNKPNSSIEFDIAVNFVRHSKYQQNKDAWDTKNHQVYIQLDKEVSVANFEKSTAAFTNLHYKEEIDKLKRDGVLPDQNNQYMQLHLFPFEDNHFLSFPAGKANVSKTLPYLVLGVAFLILLIACVNFVNMNIAKSSTRLKEIGMRKTLGATKKHVFFQFWFESILIFLTTIIIGVGMSVLLLDPFKTLFNTEASLGSTITPVIGFGFILAFFMITLLAGGYPALLLSKLGTLQVLKGKLNGKGRNHVRDVLIIIQFAIVILLTSGAFVLWGQLDYMRSKDLGFNKEHVISFPLNGKRNSYEAIQLIREELERQPNIVSVTGSDNNLGIGKDGSVYQSILGFDHKGKGVKTNMLVVDYDYPETLDIELKAGRTFNRSFPNDSKSILINEAMAKELEESDPINKQIMMDDSIKYTIIGVIKDYNFRKLNKKIDPITLFMDTEWDLYYGYVKIAPTNIIESYDNIKSIWQKIEPQAAFLGSFLDENIDRTFRSEKIMITIITSGAIVAVILSCIGLLAISLLVVNQRTKEIGVRKVIGASVSSITILLAKDFIKLVLIAFACSVPIAWWSTSNWLENYSYHIDLTLWFFVISGILAILIALATISVGTIKAAMQNPVKSLRTE
ncbi:ABC transporter permease [Aquimarina pacifica]|uniref:ABC transporter permease n=1 Tax=Aquimarina pacifica TaxID=1296415 RepID=UPI00046E93BB|nr:ABC transporter permease [Aquimarina pacifica]